jgi:uncharacterized membrane protein HdeD (DUF308 family)
MEAEMRESVMAAFARLWWLELVFGCLWIIASLIILQFNSASVTTIGVVVGILFLAAGAQELLIAAISERWRWLWAFFGLLFIAAGIVALVNPTDTFARVADILGFLFLVVGIFWTIEAMATREVNELWWLGLVAGIGMIVLAFWAAGQFFFTQAYTLLVFAGIWTLMHGITDLARAFVIRKMA